MKVRRTTARLLTLTALLWAAEVRGQDVRDADTLPQGTGGLLIQPAITYGQGSVQRFGRGWQFSRESLIADFNNIDLTEVIAGNDADTIAATIGNLGTTNFVGTQQGFGLNFMLALGITDRFTLVGLLPWMSVDYEVDVWLTPHPSNQSRYRVKDPQAINCPGGNFQLSDPSQLNQIIEDGGANYQFSVGDLQRALVSDCLGYRDPVDRIERRDGLLHGIGNRSFSGFRDFIVGAKYQFFHGQSFNLAGITYVVTPTGKPDDPDDLFDFNFGDGQWDWAVLGAVTLPLGDFRLAASAGYEISFGDSINRRLNSLTFSDDLEIQLAEGRITEEELFDKHLDDASMIPIVTRYDQAVVDRKLGDTVYVYSGVGYQVTEWLSVGLTLDWLHHFRDQLNGIGARPEGADPYPTEAEVRATVDQLIADGVIDEADRIDELRARLSETVGRKKAAYAWRTVRGNLVGGVGINFNTLPMFLRGDFPLPLIASLSMSRFLAGQNLDTPDAINLSIVVPFVFLPPSSIKDPAEYGYDDVDGQGLPWP